MDIYFRLAEDKVVQVDREGLPPRREIHPPTQLLAKDFQLAQATLSP